MECWELNLISLLFFLLPFPFLPFPSLLFSPSLSTLLSPAPSFSFPLSSLSLFHPLPLSPPLLPLPKWKHFHQAHLWLFLPPNGPLNYIKISPLTSKKGCQTLCPHPTPGWCWWPSPLQFCFFLAKPDRIRHCEPCGSKASSSLPARYASVGSTDRTFFMRCLAAWVFHLILLFYVSSVYA